MRLRLYGLSIAILLACAGTAAAQESYPNRPVRWIVPFVAGGPTDTLSRILTARLGEIWGQSVVVENKGGASGAIGADLVAKAAPDGYTVMLGTQSTNASNILFFPNLPYDPIKDFQPLTLIGTACMALVIPPSVPANTAKEFVDWVKKQDGGVAYASAAPGSSQHVAAELLVKRTGIKATHVPYRGSAAAMPDLMSGRIAYMFDNLPSALPQARAGKVKALAQTCAKRSPSAPDLPTMEEAGFPDFAIEGWYGIFAPARTPRPIVDKLSADINKVLMEPASLERWKTLGFDPIGTTPEAFAERQKADLAYWKRMIDDTGIKVE
ncbi:Bug family tripartite tricarboxylate transporter substrate binding protein [Reyranella sp.]|uniref:Bug family tripartite tricarboxylate transporter substrate binding protein n=1 Tax=Reyranella sp. TaxID=1929291 RepID=UPI003784B572